MWLIDPNKVMSEILDGEAVIIDLATGSYHAAAGVAGTVWEGMVCGHSLDRIMGDVRRSHTDVPADAETAVRTFIDSVVAAGLAQPATNAGSTSDSRVPAGPEPTPWSVPVLESHDDLADLMLLDPVHDVTNLGWPHASEQEQ